MKPGKQANIRSFILDEIHTGRLGPGMRLYSRKELMDRFACARATADAAVADLLRDGILTSRRGDGTFTARRGESGRRSGTALLSPGLADNSLAREIVAGLIGACGKEREIRHFVYGDAKSPKGWEFCRTRESLVFVMPDVGEASLLIEARREGLKHLVVYRDAPESSFVCIDNAGAVRGLTEELKRRGCERIAYWGARHSRYHFSEQRYIGYLEGLFGNGLPFDRELVLFGPENREDEGVPRLLTAMKKHRRIGLICEGRPIGRFLAVCERVGLKPGKDFLFASFDPVEPGRYPFPILCLESVTSVAGRTASRILDEIDEKNPTLVQEYICPSVIEIKAGE